jgi:hypothetical protein
MYRLSGTISLPRFGEKRAVVLHRRKTDYFYQLVLIIYHQYIKILFDVRFDNILSRSNNIFELMTNEPIDKLIKHEGNTQQKN